MPDDNVLAEIHSSFLYCRFYCFDVVIVYYGKYDLCNFFEEVPVIFEIRPKELRDGEYKQAVRELQEYVFININNSWYLLYQDLCDCSA